MRPMLVLVNSLARPWREYLLRGDLIRYLGLLATAVDSGLLPAATACGRAPLASSPPVVVW